MEFHLGHNFTPIGSHIACRDFTASSTPQNELLLPSRAVQGVSLSPSSEGQGGRGVVPPGEQRLSLDSAYSPA